MPLSTTVYSAALCRGLIEAQEPLAREHCREGYSAALCRGLIEADGGVWRQGVGQVRIPRLYAAASLKLPRRAAGVRDGEDVFRGFMPRPH